MQAFRLYGGVDVTNFDEGFAEWFNLYKKRGYNLSQNDLNVIKQYINLHANNTQRKDGDWGNNLIDNTDIDIIPSEYQLLNRMVNYFYPPVSQNCNNQEDAFVEYYEEGNFNN